MSIPKFCTSATFIMNQTKLEHSKRVPLFLNKTDVMPKSDKYVHDIIKYTRKKIK